MKPYPRLLLVCCLVLSFSAAVCLAQRGGRGGGGRGGGSGGGASETERGLEMLNKDVVRIVYPYDLAMAGTDATIEISYVVNTEGQAANIKVEKTSNKDAAAALVAALDETIFSVAKKDGKADGPPVVSPKQTLTATIRRVQSTSDLEFIEALKNPATTFVTQREVDGGLRPLNSVLPPPMFPSGLRKSKVTEGTAVVEFYIDESGIVRMPRILSASDPAFGWSAASAVLTWRFAPPTKDGVPVKVKVTGLPPFEIKLPPQAPAAKTVVTPTAPAGMRK